MDDPEVKRGVTNISLSCFTTTSDLYWDCRMLFTASTENLPTLFLRDETSERRASGTRVGRIACAAPACVCY